MQKKYFDSVLFLKIIAAISYVGFLWVIPFFFKKDDPVCYFHGKQGLVVFFFWAILFYLGWIIGWPVLLLAPILLFIDIFALCQAYKGRVWRIPLMGKIADKIG